MSKDSKEWDWPYERDEDYYPLLGRSYPPKDSNAWKSRKILKRLAEEHPQFYEDNFGKGKRKRERRIQLLPSSYRNKRFPLRTGVMMRCAETSLSSWNKKSLSEKGPEYELVEAVGCLSIRVPAIYHCNFIARRKDSTENKLFFAELMHDYETGTWDFGMIHLTPPLRCLFCCILGSPAIKTGLCGCTICDLDPGLIQHPEHGGFQKKGKHLNLDGLTPEQVGKYVFAEMG